MFVTKYTLCDKRKFIDLISNTIQTYLKSIEYNFFLILNVYIFNIYVFNRNKKKQKLITTVTRPN